MKKDIKNMDSNDKFFNIEQLLRDGNTIKIKPQGYSMYPLFFPGRDEAVIEPVDHRIWKIRGQSFYMVGDNQTEIEGPLEADQFLGKLCAFVHNGHSVSVKNPLYRMLTSLWLLLRPFRPFLSGIAYRLKHLGRPSADQEK